MKKKFLVMFLLVISFFAGIQVKGIWDKKIFDQKNGKSEKFRLYYNVLNRWLNLKHEGKSLEEYFIAKNYNNIAIYGMGEIGNRLYDELKNSEITIKYVVDKEAADVYSEIVVLDLEDKLEEVDAIIVTAIFAYDDIKEELSKKIKSPIISLENIIYEV